MLTPSYTPNYIKLTIDQVDCMRRKKSLNLCGLSLSVPRWMLREANLAVKEGFEPSKRYKRLHTFQACSFSHSDTSPRCAIVTKKKRAAKLLQHRFAEKLFG